MNEFEQKDYDLAKNYADSIKSNAENIMSIFNNLDLAMKSLYGEGWQSTGADESNGRYNELRKNYEVFYEHVISMRDHIYTVTGKNIDADTAVSSNITNV